MKPILLRLKREAGVTAVFVAIIIVMLLGFAALAIDAGHLYVVRNELQNAADAGALAGARNLYNGAGTLVNVGANETAFDASTENLSQKVPVDVRWITGSNAGDVQRGHWSFGISDPTLRGFTAQGTTDPPDLTQTTAQLDADPNFINAVRVCTRRGGGLGETPVASFFARIFGFESLTKSSEAVAYIGYAGTLGPGEADAPFAVCKQKIIDSSGNFTCLTGRMINSSSSAGTSQSGAWSNFSQPCETATPPTVTPLICGSGNPSTIMLGQGIGTTNGMDNPILTSLRTCWMSQTGLDTNGDNIPDRPWKITLPVIDCDPDNDGTINIGPCMTVVGAVEINILWITPNGNDPSFSNVPTYMYNPNTGTYWSCTGSNTAARRACWNNFASTFNLRTVGNNLVDTNTYLQKSIYFLPDCAPHVPEGTTGGENFGILAKIPVLVK